MWSHTDPSSASATSVKLLWAISGAKSFFTYLHMTIISLNFYISKKERNIFMYYFWGIRKKAKIVGNLL